MNGLILAAGRGSRLGQLTAYSPKGMVSLAGRSLIDWELAALRAAGVTPVTLITGYCAEALRHTGDYRIHNPRWESSNMVRSLLAGWKVLSRGDTVVSYSDIVYHPDHVRALMAATDPVAITYDRLWEPLWTLRQGDPLRDAETFRAEDGRVVEIGRSPKSIDEVQGQYMGLLRFTPEAWDVIMELVDHEDPARIDRMAMTDLIRVLMDFDMPVQAVPVDGRWCEADSPEDLAKYEAALAAGDWDHDWRWENSR